MEGVLFRLSFGLAQKVNVLERPCLRIVFISGY